MKAIQFLRAAIVLIGILLSACAPVANSVVPANVGGGKDLSDVVVSGVIESMTGNQWVISGQTVQVDSTVLRDGLFAIGDIVKVEASVADDGSVTAQRVETSSAVAAVASATSAPENSLSPFDGSAPLQVTAFDNSGNEAFGTVDAITDTSVTVGGQTYTLSSGFEMKGDIVTGSAVKLHLTLNSDGTFSVSEIELVSPTQVNEDNGTDDPATHDVNDDHGGATSSTDDGANHDTNDNHGGDTNSGGGGGDNSGGNSGHGG
jgi:hypothetical protein